MSYKLEIDISDARKGLKKLRDDAAKALGGIADDLDGLSKGARGGGVVVDDVAKAIKSLANARKTATAELKSGIINSDQYNKRLKDQKTSLTQIAAAQDRASKEYRQAVTELSRVENQITRANKKGKTFGETMRGISGSLNLLKAAAGAAILERVARQFREGIDSTKEYTAAILDGVNKTGLQIEEFQELQFAFKQARIEQEDFIDVAAELNQVIGEAFRGEARYREELERLGVSVKDANGNLRRTPDVLIDIIKELEEFESSSLRAAVAAELFGDDVGRKVQNLVQVGADGLVRYREEARRLGLIVSGETLIAFSQYQERVNTLTERLKIARVEIIAELLPAFEGLAGASGELLVNAANAASDSLTTVITRFRDAGVEGAAFRANIANIAGDTVQLGAILVGLGQTAVGVARIAASPFAALGAEIGNVIAQIELAAQATRQIASGNFRGARNTASILGDVITSPTGAGQAVLDEARRGLDEIARGLGVIAFDRNAFVSSFSGSLDAVAASDLTTSFVQNIGSDAGAAMADSLVTGAKKGAKEVQTELEKTVERLRSSSRDAILSAPIAAQLGAGRSRPDLAAPSQDTVRLAQTRSLINRRSEESLERAREAIEGLLFDGEIAFRTIGRQLKGIKEDAEKNQAVLDSQRALIEAASGSDIRTAPIAAQLGAGIRRPDLDAPTQATIDLVRARQEEAKKNEEVARAIGRVFIGNVRAANRFFAGLGDRIKALPEIIQENVGDRVQGRLDSRIGLAAARAALRRDEGISGSDRKFGAETGEFFEEAKKAAEEAVKDQKEAAQEFRSQIVESAGAFGSLITDLISGNATAAGATQTIGGELSSIIGLANPIAGEIIGTATGLLAGIFGNLESGREEQRQREREATARQARGAAAISINYTNIQNINFPDSQINSSSNRNELSRYGDTAFEDFYVRGLKSRFDAIERRLAAAGV